MGDGWMFVKGGIKQTTDYELRIKETRSFQRRGIKTWIWEN